jgi:hypothetical protein
MNPILLRKLRKLVLLPLTTIFMVLAGCFDDNFDLDRLSDRIGYTASFVLPLAHGDLTLGNYLEPDDSTVFFNDDSSIRLVVREDSVFSVSLSDVFEFPLPDTIYRSFTTEAVSINDLSGKAGISLGEITSRMKEPEASAIRGSAGRTGIFPSIPPQSLGGLAEISIENIEYVMFSSGELELTARNNLPAGVSMEVRLVNLNSGSEAGRFVFENIGPGQSASRRSSLEGKKIEKAIRLEVVSFSTSSSNTPVLIDLAGNIEFVMGTHDLRVVKGMARIEKTRVASQFAGFVLNFRGDVGLKELNVKEGVVHYLFDNYNRGLTLEVLLANVTSNGETCGFQVYSDGSGGQSGGRYLLTDADFDIPDDVRIMMQYDLYVGSDDGSMSLFDLSHEELGFKVWFSDFSIGYISGYLGQDVIELEIENFRFITDIFNKISGDFRLTNPSARIFYENSGGVPSELLLNITGFSADAGRHVSLFNEARRNFGINHPDKPYSVSSGEIRLDRESSNIVDFIALPPSFFKVDAALKINPDGPSGGINFITSESSARMGMEFEIPLDMQLRGAILTDTLPITIAPDDIGIIENLIMHLQVTNGLPAGASVNLSLYDSLTGRTLHTFKEMALMESPPVDANGMVVSGREVVTEAELEIPGHVVDLLKQASHLIILARLDTGRHNGKQVPVKFLTTDRLNFRLKLKAGVNVKN